MAIQLFSRNKEMVVECYRNLNLLAHAQMEEVEVGSRCGGQGICGKDKVKVVAGKDLLSPLTDAEFKHLTQFEISEGWRLACQCWPQKDGEQIIVHALSYDIRLKIYAQLNKEEK